MKRYAAAYGYNSLAEFKPSALETRDLKMARLVGLLFTSSR